MSVVIETTIGDLTVDLYLKERPNTCLNFLKLCKIKYYNLCLFHKIEKNFIAQSGDPSGSGRGGESIFCRLYGEQAKYFDSEFKPRLKHVKLGTLSMVNNGHNMNGSQFFLTLGENLTYLDEEHTVFGEVVEGFPTLLKLNEAICDDSNRPYQDIRITHTVILYDPYDDPQGLVIPDASPEPTREQLESGYIAADEEIDDTKGRTAEEIEERIKESEAKARATILEMVGDIPDADVKPPENVLFVCKLNPVTTSEDLEIIFSRFGPILSCEVIKDHKTGDSLQYAFIEFEKEEDCENAYFKMDNVLIDDRRIHVDFSQSVSKLNFSKDGKMSHHKPSKNSVVLKSSSKKSDGYDLLFDDGTPEYETDKSHKKLKPKISEKDKDRIRNKRHDRKMSRSPSYSKADSNRQRERFRSRSPRRKNFKDDEHQSSNYRKSHSYRKDASPESYNSRRFSDRYDKYSSHKESVSNRSNKSSYSSKGTGERHDDTKKSSRHQEYSYPKRAIQHYSDEKQSSSKMEKLSRRDKHRQKSSERSSSSPSPVPKRSKVIDTSIEKKKQAHRKRSCHKISAEQSSSPSSSSESSSSSNSSFEKNRKSKAKKKHSSKKKKKHH